MTRFLSETRFQTSSYCISTYLQHGLQASTTLLQRLSFHQRHLDYTRKDFKAMSNTTYGMILTYGDFVMIKCIPDVEIKSVLHFCHAAPGGVFDVWGIDFVVPFLVSNGYSYILLAIDYVSRWVEAIATKTNDAKVVVDFLKSNIFCWFGVPKVLISDQGSHFCNRVMSSLLHN
ncbi:gag-pol, partial [Mucuna pruriens]